MKQCFEKNKYLESIDKSFGVFDFSVYEKIYQESLLPNHALRKLSTSHNKCIGYFHLNLHEVSEGICWISMFHIVPCKQRRGIGSKLYAYIESEIQKKSNIQEIMVQVYLSNSKALLFWISNGFCIIKDKTKGTNAYIILTKKLIKIS